MDRRRFMITGSGAMAALVLGGCTSRTGERPQQPAASTSDDELYGISLAQWSLHRALRAGEMDNLDFAVAARRDYGIAAVEYVNQFFKDRASDTEYLAEMKRVADGEGVRSLLIMCDGEGNLGSADVGVRADAVENHARWIEAADYLGCHTIRVNALDNAEALGYDEQMKLSADGLRALSEIGEGSEISVIVENHGSLSSNGAWLASVMKLVDHPSCGTLPDFGNFCIKGSSYPPDRCEEPYDIYTGVEELMPFAKAVSAKSHDFDASGNEALIDYDRMMRIVLDAGYRGYVGVEYEGNKLSEKEGILATRDLLIAVRDRLAPEYT